MRSKVVIGVCVGPSGRFESVCKPALLRFAADAEIIVLHNQRSIAGAYNEILRRSCEHDDLVAVVLIHDDVELLDDQWLPTILGAMQPESTAILGVIGGAGPGGMAWFSREQKFGHVSEPHNAYDFDRKTTPVDVIDGLFIAFSPWAAHNLRFDVSRYPAFHGYDADICSQARAAGREVLVAPINVLHHTSGAYGSPTSYYDWIRAHHAWRLQWAGLSGGTRVVAKVRKSMVPLEARLRPSMRARRNELALRSGGSGAPMATTEAQADHKPRLAADLGERVTVVIPALNAAATLRDQLSALDAQRFSGEFSVVVVDNGSLDDTVAIAMGYAPSNYSVQVVHEPRRGVNFARNAGVAACANGVVMLCDADDIVSDVWLQTMIDSLRPGHWVSGELDYGSLNTIDTLQMWEVPPVTAHAQVNRFVDTGFGGNCCFYRSMWEQLGGFDNHISGAGDENEFFFRAWKAGFALIWSPVSIVQCRLRPGTRALVQQRFRKGRSIAKIRGRQGDLGPKESLAMVLKSWFWLALTWPQMVRGRRQQNRWLRVAALRCGALVGRVDAVRRQLAPSCP